MVTETVSVLSRKLVIATVLNFCLIFEALPSLVNLKHNTKVPMLAKPYSHFF